MEIGLEVFDAGAAIADHVADIEDSTVQHPVFGAKQNGTVVAVVLKGVTHSLRFIGCSLLIVK